MPSSLAALKTSVLQMVAALSRRLDDKLDRRRAPKMLVNEYTTVTAGSSRQYDLQALLGSEAAYYDRKTADITIRVKDSNPTSPLYNLFVNAEAIVTYGMTVDERYATLVNQASVPVELYIKVVVYPVEES